MESADILTIKTYSVRYWVCWYYVVEELIKLCSLTVSDSSLEVFREFTNTRGSFVLTVLPCEFIPTAINTVNSGLPLHGELYFALLLFPSTSGCLLSNVEKNSCSLSRNYGY